MAYSVKVGAFNTGTGAVASTTAVTGVGFTPKAVILWWSGRTENTDTIGRASLYRGIGFSNLTESVCSVSNSIDAQAAGDSARGMHGTSCITTLDSAGAYDGRMNLTSFDVDGFTLTVQDVMPRDERIHYMALGGTDLTNTYINALTEPAATGNQAITGVGFQPDLLLFSSDSDSGALPISASNGGILMFGAATSSTSRYVWCGGSDEGVATMDTASYCIDDGCIALMPVAIGGSIDARADLVTMGADGFTLNWAERASNRRVLYLALKGGNYQLGDLLTQTDTVTDITETGFGFQPSGALFVSHGMTKSTSDTGQSHDRFSMGGFSDTTNRGTQGTLDENGVADSEVTTAVEHDEVYVNIATDSTIDGLMDIKSVDADGFTCIMDNADPAQAFVWYVAFGLAAASSSSSSSTSSSSSSSSNSSSSSSSSNSSSSSSSSNSSSSSSSSFSTPPAASPLAIPPILSTSSLGVYAYEVWLTTDAGVRLALLTTMLGLNATWAVDKVGWFSQYLPVSTNLDLIKPDRLVQIWRAPRGGRLKLWRVYFLRKWTFANSDGKESILIEGPDTRDLLRRRIVAAYTASAQASKTDFADDMMKEVVTQSIADGVAPVPTAGTRVWSNLSIAADVSLGPTITKSFPFDKLLTGSGSGAIPAIQKAAREAGTEVFWDIVPNVVSSNSISFIFKTYTGQPGQDVSDRVVFDLVRGSLKNPSLTYDYSEEENYIYAGGKGEEGDRNIQQVYDSTRYVSSIWNRCEGFADARNQSTNNSVRETGRAQLEEGRPKIRFVADLIDTENTRFERDWDLGYLVKTQYRNIEFNSIVKAVSISVDESGEKIGAKAEFES